MDNLTYIQKLLSEAADYSTQVNHNAPIGSTKETAGAICAVFFRSLLYAMEKVSKPEKSKK